MKSTIIISCNRDDLQLGKLADRVAGLYKAQRVPFVEREASKF
jgi:hypothetical protein